MLRLQESYLHWLVTDVQDFVLVQSLQLESEFESRLQDFTLEVLRLQSTIINERTLSSDEKTRESSRILPLFDGHMIAPVGPAARATVAFKIALPSAALTGAVLFFSWPLALMGLASVPIAIAIPTGRAKMTRVIYDAVGKTYEQRINAISTAEGTVAAREALAARTASIRGYVDELLHGLEAGLVRAIETSRKGIQERDLDIRLLEHAADQVSQLEQELFIVERQL
jgi:hypothetical protein